jgi:hypothetical protein
LGSTAQAQADTSRGRPIRRAATPTPAADSGRTSDIEVVEMLMPAWPADPMDSVVRRRMLDSLETRRRFWNERRPRQYVIRVLELSGCFEIQVSPRAHGELLRDRLVVRDTTVVRRERAPIAAAYAQRCRLEWRVDDLFTDVARALADTAAWIGDIEYDPAYGFPRRYRIDRGPVAVQYGRNELVVLVESFAPAP